MSSGLSFKLTKTLEKKVLQDSKLRDEATKDKKEELDYIQDVQGNKIIGTIKDTSNEPLVIPLITKNKWREADKAKLEKKEGKKEQKEEEEENRELTIQERAAREILEESRKELQNWEERGDGPQVDEVPLLLSNAVPKGFETDENLDVSLRAEESTLEDYESIPVEKFGLAVLRGMGWRPEEGIGGFNKKVVKTVEPVVRPKGLGLGASRPKPAEATAAQRKEGEEKLELKKGAFIRVESGRKAGLYGEVEGFDEENARLMVKLAMGNEKISISENIVQVVSAKEYKEWGKILNKEKYEESKEKEKKRSKKEEREEEEEDDVFIVRSRSGSREKKAAKKKSHRVYSDEEEEEEDRSRSSSPDVKRYKVTRTWVRPDLRVRCIDKKYKDGRYYNSKVSVIDVVTNDRCDCRTDEGRLLEGMRTEKLETVIPRELGARVMIVQGSSSGEVAELVDRDKAKCRATLRLVHSGKLIQKNYEDICDFLHSLQEDTD